MKQWYEGDATNYGILLKPRNETTSNYASYGVKGYLWPERYNSATQAYPFIALTYRNNKGIESYWEFNNATTSDGDTIAVNTYSGNPVIIHEDASTDSTSLPVTVSHIFNGYQANEQFAFMRPYTGKGWKLDIQETIRYATHYGLSGTALSNYPYVYMDGDGTEHYFKKTKDNKMIDEDGLGLTLTMDSTSYTITDKQGNIMKFNIDGNITMKQMKNGNEIKYNYDSSKVLTEVVDESSKKLTLTYNSDKFLTKITNWNGEVTEFTYSSGYLTEIKDPYGKITKFTYDDEGQGAIVKVTAKDNSAIGLEYSSMSSGKQVKFIKEYGTSGGLGQTLQMTRNDYNITAVKTSGPDGIIYTDDDVITKYEFDNAGRLTTVYGYTTSGKDLGANSITMTSSAPKGDDSDIKKLNRISRLADLDPTILNLLTNHSAENSATGWISGNSTSSASATYSVDATNRLFGEKSFKISVTNSLKDARSRYIQDINKPLLKASTTYTMSAYVKTSGIQIADNSAPGGAMLLVAVKSSSGWKDIVSEYVKGTSDTQINEGWRRISVTFTTPSDVEYIRCMMVMMNATGTAYFDGVQLEEGATPNAYNMIENASFERITNNLADSWSGTNLATQDTPSTNTKKYGSNSYALIGDGKVSKDISQTIKITGSEEDTYALSGWLNGKIIDNTVNDSARRVDIVVTIKYSDGSTYTKSVVEFNKSIIGWKYGAGTFNLSDGTTDTKTPVSLTVKCRSYHQGNIMYFDGIQLNKKDVDIYSYDDNGNLLRDGDNRYTYANNKLTNETNNKTGINISYDYDDNNGNLEKTIDNANGITTKYSYDAYNNQSKVEITNNNQSIITETIYKNNGSQLHKAINEEGKITSYDYNDNGLIQTITDPNGTKLNYEYANGKVTKVIQKNDITSIEITNGYDNMDRLNLIDTSKSDYSFEYDEFNNLTKVKVDGSIYSTNVYQSRNGALSKIQLANGKTFEYTYDEYGNTLTSGENNDVKIINIYDKVGNLVKATDKEANITINYDYDEDGRIIRADVFSSENTTTNDGWKYGYEYCYDENDRLIKRINKTKNGTTNNTITYKNGSIISSFGIDNSKKITFGYDSLNRVTSKSINTTNSINISYGYKNISTTQTTNKIQTETIGGKTYTYEYDNLGNISKITAGSQTITYTYDIYSRLARENNQVLNKTITYSYDGNGNIVSKKEYTYTTGTLSNPTNTINYGYNGTTDRLTSYNGQTIGNYDQIGNPKTYRVNTLTWDGRELTSIKQGNNVLYS